ncbi:MAG TPA: PrsW family glutamic-type intramembrane protease [Thermoanaerobaculia bacterium]
MELAAARPLQPAKGSVVRYVGDAIWAARIIAAVAIVLAVGVFPTIWHQLAFLIGLTVLTYPVRSVRWGLVYNFFLFGMLFSVAIIGLQFVIERVILGGKHALFGSVFVAPVTEETLKIAPLIALLFIARLGFRYAYGATDLMLCGAALGSGFGFVEDALRHAKSFPTPATPHLLGYAVFRDSYNGFIGHGGSTAIIALAIGWLLYALRWKKTAVLGWIVVAIATYWMMIDHALANYQVSTSSANWLFAVRWIWQLDRHGALSPYVAFAALVLTLLVERLMLWRNLRPIPRLRAVAVARFIQSPLRGGISYGSLRQVVVHCRRLSVYILTFRQLAYLGGRLRGDRPINRQQVATLIRRRTGQVIAMQAAARRA